MGLFTGYKTKVNPYLQRAGLDKRQSSSQSVTDAAQERGWRYTLGSSIYRDYEQNILGDAAEKMKKLGVTSSSQVAPTKRINMYGEEAQDDEFSLTESGNPITAGLSEILERYDTTEINLISKEDLDNSQQLKDLGLKFETDTTDIEVSELIR